MNLDVLVRKFDHISRNQAAMVRSLHRRKGRSQENLCLVEGVRAVEAALSESPNVRLVAISGDESGHSPETDLIVERACSASVKIVTATAREMETMSGVKTPQGVLAAVEPLAFSEESLLDMQRVLILAGVQDPGNVGTMIRTAAWFGVDAVLVGQGSADPNSPKAVRASMGAIWAVASSPCKNELDWMSEWKRRGGRLFAADLGGTHVEKWRPASKSALIVGSEAHGIQDVILGVADERLTIPRRSDSPAVESLNAATAAAILMERWSTAIEGAGTTSE